MPMTIPSSEEDSPRRLIVAQHRDGVSLTIAYEGVTTAVIVHPGQLKHAIEVEEDKAAKERKVRVVRYAESLQATDAIAMIPGKPLARYIAAAEAAIDALEAAK